MCPDVASLLLLLLLLHILLSLIPRRLHKPQHIHRVLSPDLHHPTHTPYPRVPRRGHSTTTITGATQPQPGHCPLQPNLPGLIPLLLPPPQRSPNQPALPARPPRMPTPLDDQALQRQHERGILLDAGVGIQLDGLERRDRGEHAAHELETEQLVGVLGGVAAAEAGEDGVAGVALDEDAEALAGDAVAEAEVRAPGVLAARGFGPARAEAEFEGGEAGAVAGREAGEEGFLGVEEAAVEGEEAEGLGVEDAVGFLVQAVGGEEEGKAGEDEAMVGGVWRGRRAR